LATFRGPNVFLKKKLVCVDKNFLKRFKGQNVSQSELKTVIQTKPRFRRVKTFLSSAAFARRYRQRSASSERFVPRNVLLKGTYSVWGMRSAFCVLNFETFEFEFQNGSCFKWLLPLLPLPPLPPPPHLHHSAIFPPCRLEPVSCLFVPSRRTLSPRLLRSAVPSSAAI
jgi:hypothetical protein